MFKLFHDILTNKLRLFNIKKIASPLCNRCNVVEDNLHMFSICSKVKNLVLYFRNILKIVCGIKSTSMKDLIYLQNTGSNKLQRNTQIVLTSTFIATVWNNRDRTGNIEMSILRAKLLCHFRIISLILRDRMNSFFTEKYCRLTETLADEM